MLSPTIRYFILINVLISSYPVRIKFSSGDSQPKLKIKYFIAECDSGWKKFGDSCFKSYGDGTKVSKAQDICMEEGANLFYPESLEEMFWVEQFLTTDQNLFMGFRGFDETTKMIINMDYSENIGIRPTTRK